MKTFLLSALLIIFSLPIFAQEDIPQAFEVKNIKFYSVDANGKVLQKANRNKLDHRKLDRLGICFEVHDSTLSINQEVTFLLFLTNSFNETYIIEKESGVTSDGRRYTKKIVIEPKEKMAFRKCEKVYPKDNGKFSLGRHRVSIEMVSQDGKNHQVMAVKSFWIRN